ncbi:MAG: hypothetical protein ACK5PB_07105 [Pirellula sp.]
MTKVYQGLGLSCMYPENWKLSEDSSPSGSPTAFMIESPTSAFMTVSVFPWNVAPRETIENAREAMEAEYPESEFEAFEPNLQLRGEPIADARAGDVRFYYLDLLVISRLISFTVEKKTYLVQIQAEDRDFDKLEQVFQAMLVSMLKSLETG